MISESIHVSFPLSTKKDACGYHEIREEKMLLFWTQPASIPWCPPESTEDCVDCVPPNFWALKILCSAIKRPSSWYNSSGWSSLFPCSNKSRGFSRYIYRIPHLKCVDKGTHCWSVTWINRIACSSWVYFRIRNKYQFCFHDSPWCCSPSKKERLHQSSLACNPIRGGCGYLGYPLVN